MAVASPVGMICGSLDTGYSGFEDWEAKNSQERDSRIDSPVEISTNGL
jgi:hypothetical protein